MEYDTVTVKLKRGLLLDGKPQTEAVLREATVGDWTAAQELFDGDTTTAAETVRQQIIRIGEIGGPPTREVFDKLTLSDLERLTKAAEELESRGRAGAEE